MIGGNVVSEAMVGRRAACRAGASVTNTPFCDSHVNTLASTDGE